VVTSVISCLLAVVLKPSLIMRAKSSIDSIKVYRVPSAQETSSRVGGVYAQRCGSHPACWESTIDDRLDGRRI
jgi:hypothetical protein